MCNCACLLGKLPALDLLSLRMRIHILKKWKSSLFQIWMEQLEFKNLRDLVSFTRFAFANIRTAGGRLWVFVSFGFFRLASFLIDQIVLNVFYKFFVAGIFILWRITRSVFWLFFPLGVNVFRWVDKVNQTDDNLK